MVRFRYLFTWILVLCTICSKVAANVSAPVVINEIHYNAEPNTAANEFVELHNAGDVDIDLSGWSFSDGIEYTFPQGTSISAGAFLVVAERPSAVLEQFTISALGPYSEQLSGSGERVALKDPFGVLVDEVTYDVQFPWPTGADGSGSSMELVNPELDNDLGGSWRDSLSSGGATPGKINSVFTANAPPQSRQVNHSPKQPLAGKSAVITTKVTDPDGVASVLVEYQVVLPGAYVPAFLAKSTDDLLMYPTDPLPPNPAYHDAANWTSMAMLDDGAGVDETAGDGVYSVELPGQINRALVRYRITVADNLGATVRVPYEGDESLNFAYFVYDGVPDYKANTRSVLGTPHTHPSEAIESIPVYHVLTDADDFSQAVAYGIHNMIPKKFIEARKSYNWTGTFVYEGKVYDNIGYRLRQGNSRYLLKGGKRSFKFRFNRGNLPYLRDMAGKKYSHPWSKLSTHKMISSRGGVRDWGLYQAASFLLWNKTGTPAPHTHWFHMRVVQGAEEAPEGADGQYRGDFYGMLLAMEEYDVNFLESHNLEKGNLYKLRSHQTDGVSVRRYLQKEGVDDGSDFKNIIFNLSPEQTDSWLNQYVNYDQWYRYQAVKDAVRHYDMSDSTGEQLKNRAYYFEPNSESPLGRLRIFPWDADTSWGPNWGEGWDFCKRAVFGLGDNTPRAKHVLDYKNVVREIRDLAWTEEQIGLLIDSLSAQIAACVSADRDRWTDAPTAAGSQNDPPLEEIVADMKKFAFTGGSWGGGNSPSDPNAKDSGISGQKGRDAYLDALAADSLIPSTPQAIPMGPTNFPANRLTFQAANYTGANTFAAWKWRIAEISSSDDFPLAPGEYIKLEAVANWESEEITNLNDREITIPSGAIKVGRTYRVRLRAKDITGRWSHWSPPVEFICAEPDSATAMLAHLKVTELMFHAPAGSDFDFVELHNTSSTESLDIGGAKFTKGIDYTFAPDTSLAPGGYLVVTATTNHQAFLDYYGLDQSVPLVGPYDKGFSNGGEEVALRTSPGGTDVASFVYQDGRGWPLPADGSGHSLVPAMLGNQADGSLNYGGNWRASTFILGSPGAEDPQLNESVVINEVAAHTDFPRPPPEDSNDWIELHNTSASDVTLGAGWYLSDDPDLHVLNQWMIPAGTVIPAGGFVSFDEQTGFHTPYPDGFGLNKAGEQLLLSYLPGDENDRVVDSVRFKGQENGSSLARFPDGTGYWHIPDSLTRDAANTDSPMQLVISEIMYHPQDLTNGIDNKQHEFVEIYNPSTFAIDLFNSDGTWRLDGGINFQWPDGTTLPSMSRLLVVPFDPSDPVLANDFLDAYGLTPSSTLLLGPYGGSLANSTERVALEKPQAPDVPRDDISWVIVDEVIYADRLPWPPEADGFGPSLQRLSILENGNNPQNWKAAPSSPARNYPGGTAPTIIAHPTPTSQVVDSGSKVTYAVAAMGDGPLFYQWQLNNETIVGATNQTLILNSVQPTDSGTNRVIVINAAGTTISTHAVLQVPLLPKIASQPVGVTVRLGDSASFSVVSSGEGELQYQWALDGNMIAGADQAELSIPNVQEEDIGSYVVTVTDANGIVISEPAQLVLRIDPPMATGSFDWNTIVQTHDTQSSWTNRVVVSDPNSSETATIDFIVSLNGGGNFTKLDGNTCASGNGGNDINFLDSAEAVTLTMSLVSQTGTSDVRVNTSHFGLCAEGAAGQSSWSSSATASPSVINLLGVVEDTGQLFRSSSAAADAARIPTDYALDGTSDFFSILSADYVGTFDITSGLLHLSDVGAADGISYSIMMEPATVDQDNDGDGLPNSWEQRYFGNTTHALPDADEDEDGQSNLQEYIAGLDPTNSASLFSANITHQSSISILEWPSISGRVYSVYWGTNLLTGLQAIETNIPWTTGSFTDSVHSATDQMFYKIEVELIP